MQLVGLLAVVATLWLGYVAATSWSVRYRALRRIYETAEDQRVAAADERSVPERWLARWLIVAGYRSPNAPALFVAMTAGSAGVGLVAGGIYRTSLAGPLVQMVASVPGGVGEFLASVLQGGPLIL